MNIYLYFIYYYHRPDGQETGAH